MTTSLQNSYSKNHESGSLDKSSEEGEEEDNEDNDNNDDNDDNSSISDCKFKDGSYSATVDYYNPKPGCQNNLTVYFLLSKNGKYFPYIRQGHKLWKNRKRLSLNGSLLQTFQIPGRLKNGCESKREVQPAKPYTFRQIKRFP